MDTQRGMNKLSFIGLRNSQQKPYRGRSLLCDKQLALGSAPEYKVATRYKARMVVGLRPRPRLNANLGP